MSDEPVTFLASIAPTEGGIKVHGIDGYRLLLDIPEGELPAVMRLALLRRQVLQVTIKGYGEAGERPAKRGKKKRPDPEWGADDESDDTG